MMMKTQTHPAAYRTHISEEAAVLNDHIFHTAWLNNDTCQTFIIHLTDSLTSRLRLSAKGSNYQQLCRSLPTDTDQFWDREALAFVQAYNEAELDLVDLVVLFVHATRGGRIERKRATINIHIPKLSVFLRAVYTEMLRLPEVLNQSFLQLPTVEQHRTMTLKLRVILTSLIRNEKLVEYVAYHQPPPSAVTNPPTPSPSPPAFTPQAQLPLEQHTSLPSTPLTQPTASVNYMEPFSPVVSTSALADSLSQPQPQLLTSTSIAHKAQPHSALRTSNLPHPPRAKRTLSEQELTSLTQQVLRSSRSGQSHDPISAIAARLTQSETTPLPPPPPCPEEDQLPFPTPFCPPPQSEMPLGLPLGSNSRGPRANRHTSSVQLEASELTARTIEPTDSASVVAAQIRDAQYKNTIDESLPLPFN
jgi:hypothetical protein